MPPLLRTSLPLIALLACSATPPTPPASPPPASATQPVDLPGLKNVVTYAPDVYCGAVPEGAEGFDTLVAMGVRTVLTVDGSMPDVGLAKAKGLRYVHLPITYDGMEPARELEVARALRDLPGPIYVHCHHGKHRSAAATATALVLLGKMTPDEAVAKMRVSGTSPSYPGLYANAREARPADAAKLSAAGNAFPECVPPSTVVSGMVEIDRLHDLLTSMGREDWHPPTSQPGLPPAAIAGQLADHFRILLDRPEVRDGPEDFGRLMTNANRQASTLETLLADPDATPAARSAQLKRVSQSCLDCHAPYRDAPR